MTAKTKTTSKKAKPRKESNKIHTLILKQNEYFLKGDTKDIAFRIKALKQLKIGVKKHYGELLKALHADLRKHEYEAYITEIAFIFEELKFTLKHIKRWARTKRVLTPWLYQPASSKIIPEPYGTVLIIGPWNYPFQLLFAPLIAAIAAGNTAVLKPSELAPMTSKVIAKIIKNTYDPSYIAVVEGGVKESQALLHERFDYIFFTGGTAVGKIIMESASKHLTPVTLELGGKSPVIVDSDISLKATAKKIAWGKYINAGQTCIAPDYLLVHRSVKEELLKEIKAYIVKAYSENPQKSPYYPRIISKRHLGRLKGLMEKGDLVIGGTVDEKDLYIEPTVLDNVLMNDPVMKEEIFGPILPVIEYENLNEAIAIIRENPNPLALYLFSNDKKVQKRILHEVSAGGVVVNDTLLHVANYHLPFGGVGASGIGAYHGKHGFKIFSHMKSVIKKRVHVDILFRYPPYKIPLKLLRKILG